MLSPPIEATMDALVATVMGLPVGTNLGVLHLLWATVTGQLLPSRGAVFPALLASGLSEAAARRSWAALAYGAWSIDDLLVNWEAYVVDEGHWQPRVHGGYTALGVDSTPFWRPCLQACPLKHYHHARYTTTRRSWR